MISTFTIYILEIAFTQPREISEKMVTLSKPCRTGIFIGNQMCFMPWLWDDSFVLSYFLFLSSFMKLGPVWTNFIEQRKKASLAHAIYAQQNKVMSHTNIPMYYLWQVSWSFMLSVNLLSKICCLSSYMKFSPSLNSVHSMLLNSCRQLIASLLTVVMILENKMTYLTE